MCERLELPRKRVHGTMANCRTTPAPAIVSSMANHEHFAKLKEGVDSWNEWRDLTASTVIPDLSEANLARDQPATNPRGYTRGINLHRTILRGALLSGALVSSSSRHSSI